MYRIMDDDKHYQNLNTWTFLSYTFNLYCLSTWELLGLNVWILYFLQGVAQLKEIKLQY